MRKFIALISAFPLLAAALAAAEAEGVIKGTRVNVRLAPSTSAAVVAQLSEPAKVTVTRAGNGWVEIKAPAAYLSSRYVKDNRTTTAVNLRAGAGTSFPTYGKIAAGTTVKILEKSGDEWLKIVPPDHLRAYVSASLVQANTGTLPKLDTASAGPAPTTSGSSQSSFVEENPFKDLPTVAGSGREVTVSGMLYPIKSEAPNVKFALLRVSQGKYVIDHFVHTGGSKRFDEFANKQVRLIGASYQVKDWKNRVLKVRRITPIRN